MIAATTIWWLVISTHVHYGAVVTVMPYNFYNLTSCETVAKEVAALARSQSGAAADAGATVATKCIIMPSQK